MGENNQRRQLYLSRAIERANSYRVDYLFNSITQDDTRHTIRRHQIELMKKFTLSLACLIFFFIGAPLGAIIRKGGLGVPIVVSVILFIIYYIIDNTGYKLARDGVWEVWQGIWLSSAVLLPLGIFLTTRATKDSAVLNLDLYADFFRHLFGKDKVRKVTLKEIVMVAMEPDVAYRRAEDLTRQCRSFIANNPRLKYTGYWLKGYDLNVIQDLATSVNSLVEYTSETTHRMVATKLMDYPVIVAERILSPSHIKPLDILAMVFVPLGVPMYLIANKRYKNLIKNIESVCQCNADLMVLLQRIEDDNRTNK